MGVPVQQAIDTTTCPLCGAHPGESCVRVDRKGRQARVKTHQQRIQAAGRGGALDIPEPEPEAVEEERQPSCVGYCGFLGWTVEQYGRVTHKQACPHRCEPWCQAHPHGCPPDCEPKMWQSESFR